MTEPQKVCPICKGAGGKRTNDNSWKLCVCTVRVILAKRLGAEIVSAPWFDESPLYVPGAGPIPAVDMTTKNVFIKGWWVDLLPHLKFTFVAKNLEHELGYRVTVTTDERLRNVYLGSESYKSKAKSKRDDVATYNTIADVVGKEHHLVLIRLGFLGYPNRAMPGILKEALLLRHAANLPTWLIEEPESIWGHGNHSYSEEVGAYVATNYETIDLTQTKKGVIVPRGVVGAPQDDEEYGMYLESGDDEPKKNVMPEPVMKAKDKYDPLLGGGYSKGKKSNGWKGNKGGNGGGSPL